MTATGMTIRFMLRSSLGNSSSRKAVKKRRRLEQKMRKTQSVRYVMSLFDSIEKGLVAI